MERLCRACPTAGSNPALSVLYFKGLEPLKGFGERISPGRWGDRPLSIVEGAARGAELHGNLRPANLGSKAKPGIPPSPFYSKTAPLFCRPFYVLHVTHNIIKGRKFAAYSPDFPDVRQDFSRCR